MPGSDDVWQFTMKIQIVDILIMESAISSGHSSQCSKVEFVLPLLLLLLLLLLLIFLSAVRVSMVDLVVGKFNSFVVEFKSKN
jgi:hypothetical protein